jgi:hypothetical protein
MTRQKLNVTEPGDPEIQYAWDQWQRLLTHAGGSESCRAQADQWRQMYLGLLADKRARQAQDDSRS